MPLKIETKWRRNEEAVQYLTFYPGGGDSHKKQTGMLVGNFEFNP